MTFSTATIQGKVMWMELQTEAGKDKNRNVMNMLISVPDKRSRNEEGHYTKSTTYQARVWDAQAISISNYVEKYQVITLSGSVVGINNYNPESLKINMDFCSVVDYGYKQNTNQKPEVKTAKEIKYSKKAEAVVSK